MTERKRKSTSPYFRLPNPRDPVAGGYGPLILDRRLCRFVLHEALTTDMEKAEADIEEQWGYGNEHSYHDRIYVHNYETAVAGVYRFAAADESMGIAYWDNGQHWVILDVQEAVGSCLIGGCLAEDHPGRGVVFEIYLGEWSSSDHKWVYGTDAVKAIDWRYDVPYPDEGSTGLFIARESDDYGLIYETVALDCTSPGPCGS